MLWFPWARTGPADPSPHWLLRLIEGASPPSTGLQAQIDALTARVAALESASFEMALINDKDTLVPGWSFYSPNPTAAAIAVTVSGRINYCPIVVRRAMTIDAWVFNPTTAFSADAVAEVRLFREAGGLPTTLLQDLGSDAFGIATGVRFTTFTPRVLAVGTYYLAHRFTHTTAGAVRVPENDGPGGSSPHSMHGNDTTTMPVANGAGNPFVDAAWADPAPAPTDANSGRSPIALRRTA